jgi:hypothetical protein
MSLETRAEFSMRRLTDGRVRIIRARFAKRDMSAAKTPDYWAKPVAGKSVA